jgi:branched-chain amino acid aminotransferase
VNTAQGKWIWMDGKWVAWEDARIHVLSHVVHYGTSVFEGIRCYDHPELGPSIFRLQDHLRRLYDSARIYRMEIKYPFEEMERTHKEAVVKNDLGACYLRPVVYRGFDNLGVNPFGKPVEVAIAAFPWGRYLGPESLEKGVDVCVSSWRRTGPQTTPGMSKAGGHYMNGQLMKMEAVVNGYAEGIALDTNGFISEGSGENVFLVHKGILYTPATSSSILVGITRDSTMTLARELGIEVKEQPMPRDMLYLADEVFFSGTAVEITPIVSVDRIPVGAGQRGPVTKALQDAFFGVLDGRRPDRYGWLTPVRGKNAAGQAGASSAPRAATATVPAATGATRSAREGE